MSSEKLLLRKSLNLFHTEVERYQKANNCMGKLDKFSEIQTDDSGVHTVTTRFVGIPERSKLMGRATKKISVLLVGRLCSEVNNKALNPTYYTTEALYCDQRASAPKKLDAVHGFHFDYEDSAPHAHPVFHAHYDLSASRRWYSEIDTRIEIQNIEFIDDRREHRSIRIPTAQMDIFSVILMIVAGHWVNSSDTNQVDSFSRLLSDTDKYIPLVDLARHENLFGGRLMTAGFLPSNRWYPV